MQCHFWLGSLCGIRDTEKERFYNNSNLAAITFPTNAIAFTDIITILEDQGNQIPDKSWMLYVMEIFDEGHNKVPIELNLICQFNERDNFWAIFKGVNRYKFTEVLPSVGHSYFREIIMDEGNNSIEYRVTDLCEKNIERYSLKIGKEEQNLCFKASDQFTGIEWWNIVDNIPFHIRYKVEIANLKFGRYDSEGEQLVFRPYSILLPNKDEYAKRYPISFSSPTIKDDCICYTLKQGICNQGLKFIAR